MAKVERIHKGKQPKRPHHLADWMAYKGVTAADITRETGIDKSSISRWLDGTTPGEENQERLAAFFHCERESLFRHPDDDWLARFFKGRAKEEVERAKALLEAAFPLKTGTGN